MPNGLSYFPIVHKLTLLRSLLRFKGILDIYKIEYPKFLPSPESLLQSLTNQEKDSFLTYVLSETIAIPKFSHPAFTLIEELIKYQIDNQDNIKYLRKVLELFSFNKTNFFTLSDLSILELKLLMDTF